MSVHKVSRAIGRAEVAKLPSNAKHFGESSLRALGSLNASRTVAPDITKSIGIVSQAAAGPLETNWAAYCWFLQSVSVKAAKNPDKHTKTLLAIHEMIQLTAELTARLNQRLCGDLGRSRPQSLKMQDYLIGDHGTRQELLARIVGWVGEDGATEEILLCDPFFKPAAMELVWMIHSVRPDASYCVLTHLKTAAEAEKLRTSLIDQWRAFSDLQCPPIAIVGCYFEDRVDQFPVHDRWVLGATCGAQLGTSIADIGSGRLAAADRLSDVEATAVRDRLGRYLQRSKRHTDGRALRYVLTSI